jgi:hypothetical protein
MRHENPPAIFLTPDNIEFKFLRTLPDYAKLDKFRHKNHCKKKKALPKYLRFRFSCNYCRAYAYNCPFKLLAMKTTKQAYHVYGHGEHKHNNNNHSAAQKSKCDNLMCNGTLLADMPLLLLLPLFMHHSQLGKMTVMYDNIR